MALEMIKYYEPQMNYLEVINYININILLYSVVGSLIHPQFKFVAEVCHSSLHIPLDVMTNPGALFT